MSEQDRELEDRTLLQVLGRYVSPTRAQSILVRARRDSPALGLRGATPVTQLLARLAEGLRMFVGEADTRAAVTELTRLTATSKADAVELELRVESDIARARLAARDLCLALGTSARRARGSGRRMPAPRPPPPSPAGRPSPPRSATGRTRRCGRASGRP